MVAKCLEILRALAQRGQVDPYNCQSVVKILPEAAYKQASKLVVAKHAK